MLIRKKIFALCLAVLSMAAVANAMQYIKVTQRQVTTQVTTDDKLISQLKTTSMSKLDAGLPAENFESWFSRHRKDSAIRYEIETCDDVDARTPYAGKGSLKCVTAVSVQGGSELVLRFVAALPDKDGKSQPVECSFLSGSEGPPPESPIKRMTRLISKLSDLHWE